MVRFQRDDPRQVWINVRSIFEFWFERGLIGRNPVLPVKPVKRPEAIFFPLFGYYPPGNASDADAITAGGSVAFGLMVGEASWNPA